jgi:hypothetical protein
MPSRGVLGDLMKPLRLLLESELGFSSPILLIVLHIFHKIFTYGCASSCPIVPHLKCSSILMVQLMCRLNFFCSRLVLLTGIKQRAVAPVNKTRLWDRGVAGKLAGTFTPIRHPPPDFLIAAGRRDDGQ